MMILTKPFDEYLRSEACITDNQNNYIKENIKCLLWLPKTTFEEPHFYFLIDKKPEFDEISLMSEQSLINVVINFLFLDGDIHEKYIIKQAYFENAEFTRITKNWREGLIKYHFMAQFIKHTNVSQVHNQNRRAKFYISDSDLLNSKAIIKQHENGELTRDIIHSIEIIDEVIELGFESITTDKYIGNQKANILEIISSNDDTPLKDFIRIAEFILVATSFAERRRLDWLKCNIIIRHKGITTYQTRKTFFNDEKNIFLIKKPAFENYLKTTLKNLTLKNCTYKTNLLKSYLSSVDYSVNAKIVLYCSKIEEVLKKNFNKKNDKDKESLLLKLGIYINDLPPIKDLIDLRNNIVHGGVIQSDRLFNLFEFWQILVERVILKELGISNLSHTDVEIKTDRLN